MDIDWILEVLCSAKGQAQFYRHDCSRECCFAAVGGGIGSLGNRDTGQQYCVNALGRLGIMGDSPRDHLSQLVCTTVLEAATCPQTQGQSPVLEYMLHGPGAAAAALRKPRFCGVLRWAVLSSGMPPAAARSGRA